MRSLLTKRRSADVPPCQASPRPPSRLVHKKLGVDGARTVAGVLKELPDLETLKYAPGPGHQSMIVLRIVIRRGPRLSLR